MDIKSIILSAAMLLGLSAFFAILLAYFGTRLAVNQDKRIDLVTKKLTGANCGGCGYAGCSAYAKALVEGKASLSDCPSTPSESKNEISELLGLVNDGEETVVVTACNGGKACKNKYSYQGYGDCRSMNLLSSGSKACDVGCMGMGSCVDACHNHAIEIGGNACPVIKYEKCVNCGLCIKACPKSLIVRIPKKAKVYVACSNHDKGAAVKSVCQHGCVSCGLCAKICPNTAIIIEDNLAKIDYSKCNGCGLCSEKCPTKAIRLLNE